MSRQQVLINRPIALRTINKLGAILNSSGVRSLRLDAERILDRAQTSTSGALIDPIARAGLEVLVRSLNDEAKLSLFGRFALRSMLQRAATSRLCVEGVLASLREKDQPEIREPVFIIGMPRSGTTILHALLHFDRNHRAPVSWECLLPFPAPRAEDYESSDRLKTIDREFEQIFRLVPDFKKKHYMEADSPQECIAITALNFVSYQFLAVAYVPTYLEWFMAADQPQNLRWHKAFLGFLQSGGVIKPRRLLKSPVHMMRLPAIFEVYPDAKVIATHRHPAQVVPSTASLISSMRSLYSDEEDTRRTGREQLSTWSDYLNRFLTDRQRLANEDQIVDVYFDTFKESQMDVVDSIYERFGWHLHPADRERMQQFLREQPRDKHGVHEYSLKEFDISHDELSTHFVDYMDFLESASNEVPSQEKGTSYGE